MTTGATESGHDIVARYHDVLEHLAGPAEPELLPTRLAEAAAVVLGVDGAGLSVYDDDFRIPLGASSEIAALAERLPVTQGEGPCLTAGRDGRTLAAAGDELAREWPQFTRELFDRTPFRAVMTVPLAITSRTRGALDLFLVDDVDLLAVGLADAARVAEEISACLRRLTVAAGTAPGDDDGDTDLPWLQGPGAQQRTAVWLAVGMVMYHFELSAPDALDLLRGRAYGSGQVLDDTAAALVAGRLSVEELRP